MCVYYTTMMGQMSLKIFLMILKSRKRYLHIFVLQPSIHLWAQVTVLSKTSIVNNAGNIFLSVL